MQLPLATSLPLELLASDPGEVLPLSAGANEGLTALQITTMWRLLGHTVAQLQKTLPVYPRRTPNELQELLAAHNPPMHLGMLPELVNVAVDTPVEEIFVYVPRVRPFLTPEQIAFLRSPASTLDRLPGMDGAALRGWWSAMSMFRMLTVWDVVDTLTHLRRDQNDCIKLRTALEAVVGPLPLELTIGELQRIMLTEQQLARINAHKS